MYKTVKQVRAAFWDAHPQFKSEYRVNKKQNDYICDIRMAFIDYVQNLSRDGMITEKMEYRVTL